MGSERLGHMLTLKDPTFKEDPAMKKHGHDASNNHHSMSHTSGTQPVSVSNGPRSTPSSSSSITKAAKRLKPNPKYRKLCKLYSRQLSFIGTTLQAIESLSTSMSDSEQKELQRRRNRYNALNERLADLHHSTTAPDHRAFDQMKDDIHHLIEELKLFKMNSPQSRPMNTLDLLMTAPVEVPESDESEDGNDPTKLLDYFE